MRKSMKILRPVIISFLAMTILCGILYTVAVTGISQLMFPSKTNGSILSVTLSDGTQKDYGSALIAQEFSGAEYIIGRPMGITNLSPVSAEHEALVEERIAWLHNLDKDNKEDIPMVLVTASGSGVDPNITPAAAEYQVSRIARERDVSEDYVREIISKYTTGRFIGIFGEPAVNVLKVNLALDGLL